MTEAEWLTCTDSDALLKELGGMASDRKLRLFACAYCRRLWHLLTDERSRKVVDTAERFADGRAGKRALRKAAGGAARAAADAEHPHEDPAVASAALAALYASWESAWDAAWRVSNQQARSRRALFRDGAGKRFRPVQADLVRDIFGNPFRPVHISPSWLQWHDGCVVTLARALYEEGNLGDLPVLGDALLEAGCEDADILAHCRAGGEHVLGCWLIDRLLGKK